MCSRWLWWIVSKCVMNDLRFLSCHCFTSPCLSDESWFKLKDTIHLKKTTCTYAQTHIQGLPWLWLFNRLLHKNRKHWFRYIVVSIFVLDENLHVVDDWKGTISLGNCIRSDTWFQKLIRFCTVKALEIRVHSLLTVKDCRRIIEVLPVWIALSHIWEHVIILCRGP